MAFFTLQFDAQNLRSRSLGSFFLRVLGLRGAGALCCSLFLLQAACIEGPSAQEAAQYFGLSDGLEQTFSGSNGLEEVHSYARISENDEKEIFERVARSSGFIVDDRTFTLEATVDGLYITRYFDCITLCGELSDDLLLFNWPIKEKTTLEQEISVNVVRNNVDEGSHDEAHRIVVGTEEERSINGKLYTGFDAFWTRTIEGDVESARLFVVPEVGVASIEGFDGITLELVE